MIRLHNYDNYQYSDPLHNSSIEYLEKNQCPKRNKDRVPKRVRDQGAEHFEEKNTSCAGALEPTLNTKP